MACEKFPLDDIQTTLMRTQSIVEIISQHFIDLKDKPEHLLPDEVISDLVWQVDVNLGHIFERVQEVIKEECEEALEKEYKKADTVLSD